MRKLMAVPTGLVLCAALLAATSASAQPTASDTGQPQTVVDNQDDDFSRQGFENASTAGTGEYYGRDYFHSGADEIDDQRARWTPSLPGPGRYTVAMRWRAHENRPTQAPVTIISQGGEAHETLTVNQQVPAIAWHFLGTYQFTAQGDEYVEITNAGGPNTIADAVKFVPVPDTASDFSEDFTPPTRSVVNLARDIGWAVRHEDDDPARLRRGNNDDNAYLRRGADAEEIAWFHHLDQDGVLRARLRLPETDRSGSVGLVFRMNSDESMVRVRYLLETKRWVLEERVGPDVSWREISSARRALPALQWHDVEVSFRGPAATLTVDGRKIIDSAAVSKLGPGRTGMLASGVTADFDDLDFRSSSQQGSLINGVEESVIGDGDETYREGASMIIDQPGDVVMLWEHEQYRSQDDGLHFTRESNSYPYNGGKHNVLRLSGGKVLAMVTEYDIDDPEWDSPLRYRATIRDGDNGDWHSGGLTWEAFREGPIENKSETITMNQKLSQAGDGTVFFVVSTRTKLASGAIGHGTEVYLSKDDGETWRRAADDSALAKLSEFSEAKIIEAEGGYMLYAPYVDGGELMASFSADGEHWGEPENVPGLRNSRSSMGLFTDRSGPTPVHYLTWVFVDVNDHSTTFLPRGRLALARSKDGINWDYLGDVDRWISPLMANNRPISQFVDPMVFATDDHVLVASGRSASEFDPITGEPIASHGFQELVTYRFDKNQLPVHPWPAEF